VSIHSQYVTGRKIIVRPHPYVYLLPNILSAYNLCTMGPAEEITVSLTSTYVLTVLVADIQAFLYEGAYGLCKVVNSTPVAVLASV